MRASQIQVYTTMQKQQGLYWRLTQLWCRHFDMTGLLVLLSIIVGLLTAIAGFATHKLVHLIGDFASYLENLGQGNWALLTALPLPFLGILASYGVQRLASGKKFVKSLSFLILKFDRKEESMPMRDCFSHIVTSSLCVGMGGSAGQEAPGVLTGAAIGSNVARYFGITRTSRSILVGCGCAAALAAIFDSPVAGVLFVVEAFLPEFSVGALIPLLFSSALAAVFSRWLSGRSLFFISSNMHWENQEVLPMFICGIVCALVGVFIIRCSYWISQKMNESFQSDAGRMLVGGSLLCVALLFFPYLRSQGYELIETLLQGKLLIINTPPPLLQWCPPNILPVLILGSAIFIKAIVSTLTTSSGGDGGIFAPTMFIGAFTGMAFAKLINDMGLGITVSEVNFVALGMCGVFTAVMRSPLTGIFLIAETTGGYSILVPLMIVSSVSWFTGGLFEPDSVYRKSLIQKKLVSDDPEQAALQRHTVAECLTIVSLCFHKGQDLSQVKEAIRKHPVDLEIYPVIDNEEGLLLGVIHSEKLLAAILNSNQSNQKILVDDLMEPPSGAILPNENLNRAMQNMKHFHQHALPVLALDGRFAGILQKERILEMIR